MMTLVRAMDRFAIIVGYCRFHVLCIEPIFLLVSETVYECSRCLLHDGTRCIDTH